MLYFTKSQRRATFKISRILILLNSKEIRGFARFRCRVTSKFAECRFIKFQLYMPKILRCRIPLNSNAARAQVRVITALHRILAYSFRCRISTPLVFEILRYATSPNSFDRARKIANRKTQASKIESYATH